VTVNHVLRLSWFESIHSHSPQRKHMEKYMETVYFVLGVLSVVNVITIVGIVKIASTASQLGAVMDAVTVSLDKSTSAVDKRIECVERNLDSVGAAVERRIDEVDRETHRYIDSRYDKLANVVKAVTEPVSSK